MKTAGGRTLLWRDVGSVIEFVIVAADGRASHVRVEGGAYTVEPGRTTVGRALEQGFSEVVPTARMQLFVVIQAHLAYNAPLHRGLRVQGR